MVKSDLVKKISDVTEVSRKDAEAVINALSEVITDAMVDGDEVTIPNIGKFKVKEVGERRGTIMMGEHKGEEYVTPAHKEPSFKLSAPFKKSLITE